MSESLSAKAGTAEIRMSKKMKIIFLVILIIDAGTDPETDKLGTDGITLDAGYADTLTSPDLFMKDISRPP